MRAGVNDADSFELLCNFVRTVSEGSPVRHFIVHCRKALLNFNPHQNRTIPPLRRSWAFALARDFPHLTFSLNGQVLLALMRANFATLLHLIRAQTSHW